MSTHIHIYVYSVYIPDQEKKKKKEKKLGFHFNHDISAFIKGIVSEEAEGENLQPLVETTVIRYAESNLGAYFMKQQTTKRVFFFFKKNNAKK